MNERTLATTTRFKGKDYNLILNCVTETFNQPKTWGQRLTSGKQIRQRLSTQRKPNTTIRYLLLNKNDSDNTLSAWGARRQGYCLGAFVESLTLRGFEGTAILLIPFDDKIYSAMFVKRGTHIHVTSETMINDEKGLRSLFDAANSNVETFFFLNKVDGPNWFKSTADSQKNSHNLGVDTDDVLSKNYHLKSLGTAFHSNNIICTRRLTFIGLSVLLVAGLITAILWPSSVEVVKQEFDEVTEVEFNLMGTRQMELAAHWLEVNHALLLIGKAKSVEISPKSMIIEIEGTMDQSNINWLTQQNDLDLTLLFDQSKWIYTTDLDDLAQAHYNEYDLKIETKESELDSENRQLEQLKTICQKQHIAINVNRVSHPGTRFYNASFTLKPRINNVYSIRRLTTALKQNNISMILDNIRIEYLSIQAPDITINGQLQYQKPI